MQVNITNRSKENKVDCFGCTACMANCPVSAIEMVSDDEGFSVPKVDEKKCISCGKCIKVCPAIYRWEKEKEDIKVFAVKNKDYEILKNSTSGGMFRAIADKVLMMNGYVCGCIIDDDMKIKHVVTNDLSVVERMMGSKYVQSDMGECLQTIRKYLLYEKNVLFAGTSCQVHGLLKYLDNSSVSTDKLICLDLICHGVPSPTLFSEYVKFYEKEMQVQIENYLFRSKKYGWGVNLEDKNYISTVWGSDNYKDDTSYCGQLWKNVFFSDWGIRNCCYECPYTCVMKPADISIGDFWGIEKHSKTTDWSSGCSLVIPQTIIGKQFLKSLDIYMEELENVEEVLSIQRRLFKPINKPKDRDAFWKEYRETGFEGVAKKFLRYNKKYKFMYRLKTFMIRHNMERIANRLIGNIFY